MSEAIKRPLWRILLVPLLLGLGLRFLLMPFTMQADGRFVGDLVAMHVDARHFVSSEGSVDIALYPPLTYYTLYAYQRLLSPFFPNLDQLEKDGDAAQTTWYQDPSRFLKLFFLKLWYLPFDMLCGYLLVRLLKDEKAQVWAAWLWYLNPIIIYTGAIHGQFDVVPIFFTLLALDTLQNKRHYLAALALGLGAAFKLYPLLFVLPFLISLPDFDKRFRSAFLIGAVFLVPYAGKLAFYSVQHSYYSFGLAGVIELTQGQAYYLFGAVYCAGIFYLYERFRAQETLVWSSVIILALYYVQATFDLHYLAWVMPFAILTWIRIPASRLAWIAVILAAFMLTLRVIPYGWLLPLNLDYYASQANLAQWLEALIPYTMLTRAAHSLLIGALLWLAYLAGREHAALQLNPNEES